MKLAYTPETTSDECAVHAGLTLRGWHGIERECVDIINGLDTVDYGEAVAIWSPLDQVYKKEQSLTELYDLSHDSIISLFANTSVPFDIAIAFVNLWIATWNAYIRKLGCTEILEHKDSVFFQYFKLAVPIQIHQTVHK
jgi:hypothetical protein